MYAEYIGTLKDITLSEYTDCICTLSEDIHQLEMYSKWIYTMNRYVELSGHVPEKDEQ